jgi:UDP-3-O-[3-hydroxymyristoyl] glucosamine N-acyltransferase
MENCVIQSGARIGGTGFGFEMKTKQKINHTGNVIIGKNSSIGSNTTIDRAVFDSTIIGEFSNIDNLVQIAHNVVIGDFAVIAAQVGIAGSTQIGKNIKIGGQAGIAGHLVIGDNVTIAAKSGVTKNIPDNNVVAGFPAKDINLWKKEVIRNSLKK